MENKKVSSKNQTNKTFILKKRQWDSFCESLNAAPRMIDRLKNLMPDKTMMGSFDNEHHQFKLKKELKNNYGIKKTFKAKTRCRKCGYVSLSWGSLGYGKEVTIWNECMECNTDHDWWKLEKWIDKEEK